MTVQAQSLYASSTGQSADSIESHPLKPGLFALGTYQVQQDEIKGVEVADNSKKVQNINNRDNNDDDDDDDETEEKVNAPPFSRKGTLRLMQATPNEKGRIDVETLSTIDTEAILDMKWMSGSKNRLGVVLASSTLSLYTYEVTHDIKGRLCDPVHVQINHNRSLCLSLDWSDRNRSIDFANTKAIVSQSDGTLAHIYDLEAATATANTRKDDFCSGVETWKAHEFEAWIAAFDSWSPNGQIVWSGGDDLKLKGWDLRMPSIECEDNFDDDNDDRQKHSNQKLFERTPTFSHQRSFEGGITSIQNHHLIENLWAIGSYDEYVRLWDARFPIKPLSQTHVNGGIWRLKWHPVKRDTLLVGCMHDGFKVLTLNQFIEQESIVEDLEAAKQPMTIQTRFDDHKSLAYGCDWDRGRTISTSSNKQLDYIYSCSFYDAMLHAWSHEA